MLKLAKYVRNCVVFWENLHSWQKFYTTPGRDGRDKFQVCPGSINKGFLLTASKVTANSFWAWTNVVVYILKKKASFIHISSQELFDEEQRKFYNLDQARSVIAFLQISGTRITVFTWFPFRILCQLHLDFISAFDFFFGFYVTASSKYLLFSGVGERWWILYQRWEKIQKFFLDAFLWTFMSP